MFLVVLWNNKYALIWSLAVTKINHIHMTTPHPHFLFQSESSSSLHWADWGAEQAAGTEHQTDRNPKKSLTGRHWPRYQTLIKTHYYSCYNIHCQGVRLWKNGCYSLWLIRIAYGLPRISIISVLIISISRRERCKCITKELCIKISVMLLCDNAYFQMCNKKIKCNGIELNCLILLLLFKYFKI